MSIENQERFCYSINVDRRGAKMLQVYVLAFPEAYPRWPWQFGVLLLLFMSLQVLTGSMAYLDEFVGLSKI